MSLAALLAFVMLASLIAYAILGGADFGAGIWDLLSRGPRGPAHRRELARAIGPVWEANHVWLIFLIVLLFTCFPSAYATASIALFWPLHLVLVGIVLRGTAFVFRAYASASAGVQAAWGHVFGASSAMTPVLLGICLGAVSTGGIRTDGSLVAPASGLAWTSRFPLATGILALLICAYLAAVYLAWESRDAALKEDFRARAIGCWLVAGAMSILVLLLAYADAPRLWSGLTSPPAVAFIAGGALLAPASFASLWRRRYGLARVLGAAQVGALLLGWGGAQWPFLIYPDITIAGAAAPQSTLMLTAATLPIGFAALVPSLWLLFSVFKGKGGEA